MAGIWPKVLKNAIIYKIYVGCYEASKT